MKHFERLHSRLQEKSADVRARPLIYVAFGDSVTQGCMAHGVVEHEAVYHQRLRTHMLERYPAAVVSVINAGVSGDTAAGSRSRWARDILTFQPDLVTIGFGVNDAHGGPAGLDDYVASLRELISLVREQTPADLALLAPSGMMTRDNPYIDERDRPAVPGFLRTAEQGWLAMYRDALLALAKETDVPCLDVYDLWFRQERGVDAQSGSDGNAVDLHARLSNGINHPDLAFHAEMGRELAALMGFGD